MIKSLELDGMYWQLDEIPSNQTGIELWGILFADLCDPTYFQTWDNIFPLIIGSLANDNKN